MKNIKPLNTNLFKDISIDELEERLELEAPKTCGQYTENPPQK